MPPHIYNGGKGSHCGPQLHRKHRDKSAHNGRWSRIAHLEKRDHPLASSQAGYYLMNMSVPRLPFFGGLQGDVEQIHDSLLSEGGRCVVRLASVGGVHVCLMRLIGSSRLRSRRDP